MGLYIIIYNAYILGARIGLFNCESPGSIHVQQNILYAAQHSQNTKVYIYIFFIFLSIYIFKKKSQKQRTFSSFELLSVSDFATPELQHARPPRPSPTPGAHSDSCPSGQGCHPNISSPVIHFSSHLQSFPASGSFSMSQFFAPGGQSIAVSASASVLPMHIQC